MNLQVISRPVRTPCPRGALMQVGPKFWDAYLRHTWGRAGADQEGGRLLR